MPDEHDGEKNGAHKDRDIAAMEEFGCAGDEEGRLQCAEEHEHDQRNDDIEILQAQKFEQQHRRHQHRDGDRQTVGSFHPDRCLEVKDNPHT